MLLMCVFIVRRTLKGGFNEEEFSAVTGTL